MEKTEVKTDNEKLAKFMNINVRYWGKVLYVCDEHGRMDLLNDPEVYHPDRDWNQLMAIVDKIDKLQLFDSVEYRELVDLGILATRDTVYKYSLKFIKWYESNKHLE